MSRVREALIVAALWLLSPLIWLLVKLAEVLGVEGWGD